LNHYQHENTCLVVSTFAKQHESNELQKTILRSHGKGKKKPKDIWSNLREHKKTKESKKNVQ